jgi:chemotaxis protein histidine kinase CheA
MSDGELDFDPEELAMLRQLFRSEAHDALEAVTARILATGPARPSYDALTEMMRVTHTLKGAAGTVGLHAMAELTHRLEDALAALAITGLEAAAWTAATADRLVEIIDALRGYLDHLTEPGAELLVDPLRAQIDQVVAVPRRTTSQRLAAMGPLDPDAVPEGASDAGSGSAPTARPWSGIITASDAGTASGVIEVPTRPARGGIPPPASRAATGSGARHPASARPAQPEGGGVARPDAGGVAMPDAIGLPATSGIVTATTARAVSGVIAVPRSRSASGVIVVPAPRAASDAAAVERGAASPSIEEVTEPVPAALSQPVSAAPQMRGTQGVPASGTEHAPGIVAVLVTEAAAAMATEPDAERAAAPASERSRRAVTDAIPVAVADGVAQTPTEGVPVPVHEGAIATPTEGVPVPVHEDAIATPSQGVPVPVHEGTAATPSQGVPVPVHEDAAATPSQGVPVPVQTADPATPTDGVAAPVSGRGSLAVTGSTVAAGVTAPALDGSADGLGAPEAKPWLRVAPERVDALMSSAGELLFDRTRIERRVQLLRTLARDLARTRQGLHDALADADADPPRAALAGVEAELAGQAALLSQTTAGLLEELEALRRTIGQLQRGLTRIRMESAKRLMTHAARTLRALRRATGVRVELRPLGEDTEFDKAVAEQLLDPITQLLRNAVAHGVEPPQERAARGKPAVATITIRARQDGSSLVLEVGDDGRGIDTAALSERLVATGRWTASRAQLASEADVLAALLDASVSIRDEADALAGRGVGLGVVRQTVAMLGGEVRVASVAGKGTTFSLRLPLSTVVGHAMLFKVDGQVYAIPNVHVAATTQVAAQATTAIIGPDVLPVLRLEQLLGHGAATDRKPGLVVSFAGKSLVCSVDKIIGAREVIIKPLGPLLAPLTLYAGATISGSGKVQLILDPAQLVRRAHPSAPAAFLEPGSAPLALAGRALVVDDSRAIREAMTSMLGSDGWIVDVAEDGARALQLARQLRYDLIITDLEMPELGGFALIARLRADDRWQATPIIIITSRATPEHRRRARDLGVAALVAKPITRRKLLEALAAR